MINRKKLIMLTIFSAIFFGLFIGIGIANTNRNETRAQGCGGGCHDNGGTDVLSIGTNYTSASVTVGAGNTFAVAIWIDGLGGDKNEMAWTFWHDSGDGMGLPTPDGSEGGSQDDWTGTTLNYHAYWDVGAIGNYTRIFTFTVPFTPGTYYIYMRGVGCDAGTGASDTKDRTPEYILTVFVISTDNDPPSVLIVDPNQNDLVSGNVLINASVIDASTITSVWAEVTDGVSYNQSVPMSLDSAPYYSGIWDSSGAPADGIYTIKIKAVDQYINLNDTMTVNVNTDNTAPSIVINSINPNPSNGLTTITVSNSSSDIDANGILANVSTPSGGWRYPIITYQGANTWTGTFTVTENGLYTVTINATDLVGNTGYAPPRTVAGDVTAPSITLVSLTPNPSNGLTSIRATNASSDINVNGILANVSTPSGSWLYVSLNYLGFNQWENKFTVTENGLYTVSINATDFASNTGYAAPQTLTGDVSAPVITLVSVTPNPSNGLTTIQATNASSDININGIIANVSTPSGGWLYIPLTYQGSNNWDGSFTVTQDGTYTVTINATDFVGNTGYDASQSITGDVSAPVITLVSVTPNPSNGLTTIQATNTSTDINANGILANISTPSGSWLYVPLTYQGGNNWDGTFIVSENGIYTVTINATDFLGNVGYDTPQSITGDVIAPIITLSSVLPNPSNGLTTIQATNASTDINANGILANVSTPSGGWIYVPLTYQGFNNWQGTFSVTSDGTYTVTINATDIAGNTGYAAPQSITGDITPPLINLVTVTPNPSNGLTTIQATNASTDINANGILANVSTPSGGWLYVSLTYQGSNNWAGTFTVTEDGIYSVRINATDIVGNTGHDGPQNILGDVGPPTISLVSITPDPSNGLTTIQATNASTDINANGLLANISTPSGSWIYVALTYQGSNNWDGTFVVSENGIYTVMINATDVVGNTGYDAPQSITGDVTAPSITLVSVTPNPSKGLTTIQATNTSGDINANGILANISTPSGGWIYVSLNYLGFNQWDGTFSVAEDGIYTVSINATDIAGNTGYAGSQTITGDVTPPSITLVSVTPNPSNGVTTIQATNTSTDINAQGIRANISTPSGGWIYRSLTYMGGNNWQATFTVSQDGTYTVTINATDKVGNTGYAASQSIIADVTAPSITLVSVTPNPSNGLTTIQATNASTDINVQGILANISTPSGSWIYVALTYQGGNNWDGTFTVTANGAYTVRINATDYVGNTGYHGPQTITGDILLPQADILNPANDGDELSGAVISISGEAYGTGSNIASMYINDTRWGSSQQPQINPSNSPSGSFSFNNNTAITPGAYWIMINITDAAGNTNTTVRYFTIAAGDTTPPTLTIISINPNPSNGYTEITVTSNEALIGVPQLNITAPNSSVYYPTMNEIGANTWQTNFTVFSTGNYVIMVNGTDLVGNIGYRTRTLIGDINSPPITLVSVTPNPSNGLTTILAMNGSADIDANGILANISTPSGSWIYRSLIYMGGNNWQATFTVTQDGIYTVTINATDIAKNIGYDDPQSITGDITPPSINLVSVTPNPSNGLTTIQATNASTDINVNGIQANVSTPSDGWIYVSLTYQGGNNWDGTFTVTQDGTYTVTINATDTVGNTGYAASQSITGDVTAPTISLVSVIPNPSGGLTTITAQNSSSGINMNGLLANVSTPSGGWIYIPLTYQGLNFWQGTFTVTQDGSYIITVNATDIAGNTGYAGSQTITGDVTPPSITLVSVTPNPSNGVTTIQATNASTDINAQGIRANISTPSGGWIYRSLIYMGGNNWQATFTVTQDGTYTITINATDKVGNKGYAASQTITGDVTAPSITLVSVTPNPSNGLTTIQATNASTDINMNGIRANISTPSGGWIYVSLTYQGGNNWDGTFTVTQNGIYTVRINATDFVGNTRYAGPLSITGDISPPSITLASVTPNPSGGLTTIQANNATKDFNANGILANISTPSGGWLYVSLNYFGFNIWQGTFTVTEDGTYTVTINATDVAGNTGYAASQSITGDVTPPSITLVNVLPNPSNGQTTILATNASGDINTNGILANISTPGGGLIYRKLTYLGSNNWQAVFPVTQDGQYTIIINATDKVGNTGYDAPQYIIGDVTKPSISIVSITPNPSNGLTTIQAMNASTDINANGIRANISTPTGSWIYVPLTYQGGNNWDGTFTVTQNGIYTVRINATDFVGNTGYAGPQTIRGDVIAPSISLISVLPTLSKGLTTILAQNASTDINSNGLLANVSTPSGSWIYVPLIYQGLNFWQATFTVTEDGSHTVTVNATDVAGNTGYSTSQTITADVTAPSITLVNVLPNPSNGITTIQATNSSSDINIQGIRANISTPSGGWIHRSLSYQGANTWTAVFTVTQNGIYTVRINATDYAGNIVHDGPQSITADVVPPSISILSVTPNPSNGVTTITCENLSSDINSNGILANVSTPSGWLYPTMTYVGGNQWIGTFVVTAMGTYTVRINATDFLGNKAYAGPVSISGDINPPSITITSPISITYLGNISISAIVNAPDRNSSSVYAIITGPSSYNSGPIPLTFAAGTFSSSWDSTTGTGDGNYLVTVYASDLLGNEGSASVSFTVDNIPPNVLPGTGSVIQYTSLEGILVTVTLNGNISGILTIDSLSIDTPEGFDSYGIFLNITFLPDNPSETLGINSATLNITLSAENLTALGDIDLTLIKIYHFNESSGEWEALNTTFVGTSFIAEVSSFSIFGLMSPILISGKTVTYIILGLLGFGVILSISVNLLQRVGNEKNTIQERKKALFQMKQAALKKETTTILYKKKKSTESYH